ncbi:hypothetical protein FOZ60_014319 [Perkinsus olseni]|uniref:Uncharacterized protein n=1 Tax=Perkinsus olseni TaxID=32597 RepID=A0A7J6P757_PEROL|nr:hypothetical protein FOZ60_014319 [Perkinsus olseni]
MVNTVTPLTLTLPHVDRLEPLEAQGVRLTLFADDTTIRLSARTRLAVANKWPPLVPFSAGVYPGLSEALALAKLNQLRRLRWERTSITGAKVVKTYQGLKSATDGAQVDRVPAMVARIALRPRRNAPNHLGQMRHSVLPQDLLPLIRNSPVS